ncbi:MAG: hypothetical protein P4L46_19210 [Fimbriimonas sp.]|nr:hypothetical protein [Fimbriimonas sp.]
MANADPGRIVNGKRLIWALGLGAILFTVIMGFGTYWLANKMTPMLEKNESRTKHASTAGLDSPQKRP